MIQVFQTAECAETVKILRKRKLTNAKREELIETSEKIDGVLTASRFRVKALLIRSNFSTNSVSKYCRA